MDTKALESILISKKIKPTAMRLLTLDFLRQQQSAVSITEIENEFEACDRITLYRTLKTFEKQGLIHSIEDGKVITYALCHTDCSEAEHADTHLHFYCLVCKKILCLLKVEIPPIKIPDGFSIRKLSFIAKGTCAGCA